MGNVRHVELWLVETDDPSFRINVTPAPSLIISGLADAIDDILPGVFLVDEDDNTEESVVDEP
jgi:hypothetical protein